MKKKLSHIDRVVIPEILPREGNILTMQVVKGILGKIQIQPSQFKDLKIQRQGDRITWSDPSIMQQEDEYDLADAEVTMIKKAVQDYSAAEKISLQMLDTCARIQGWE